MCKGRNGKLLKPLDVRNHLVKASIDRSYSIWALHGEKAYMNSTLHLPVQEVRGETIEEENIEDGGLGMENLVDTF